MLTDSPAYLLIANRFTSNVPGCSQMVDSLGTDLALGRGRRPETGASQVPAVAAAWRRAFRAANWVLLTPKNPTRIPWNHALHGYFRRHFDLVRHQDTTKHKATYNLYART